MCMIIAMALKGFIHNVYRPVTVRICWGMYSRSEHSGSNVVFLEGCRKAIPPNQYNIVYTNYVLQWIHDKESAFRQVHKNLRTGGVFAFSAVEAQPSSSSAPAFGADGAGQSRAHQRAVLFCSM